MLRGDAGLVSVDREALQVHVDEGAVKPPLGRTVWQVDVRLIA
jgi:hypothetical protein